MNILKKYINETVKKFVLNEHLKIDPSQFHKLKEMNNAGQIKEYIENELKLKPWGAGSSRIVYPVSTGKVLKLANYNGSATGAIQNKAEVDAATNPHLKPIIAKVYDFHPNYLWIISEAVQEFKNPTDLTNEIDGLSMSFVKKFILWLAQYGMDEGRKEIDREYEEFQEKLKRSPGDLMAQNYIKNYDLAFKNQNKFFEDLLSAVEILDLHPGDLIYNHFGKTLDGRVVLLDYGLDIDSHQKYY